MTTADMLVVVASFTNLYDRVNKAVGRALLPFADDLVDVGRWLWRARMRRRARKPGGHRAGAGSFTVWSYFERMSDEELGKSTYRMSSEGGKHRDTRGWRHAPATWKQIPVWESERQTAQEEFTQQVYWSAVVDKLIGDISHMLENPPEPETLHGCKNCLCGLVPA